MPTLLCAAKTRSQRAWIDIDNDSGVEVFIGVSNAAVSTTTGRPLQDGESMAIVNTGQDSQATYAFYAVVASGTASILVTEGT